LGYTLPGFNTLLRVKEKGDEVVPAKRLVAVTVDPEDEQATVLPVFEHEE
jgi:hypothetical protein